MPSSEDVIMSADFVERSSFSRLLLLAADVFPPLSATTRAEFAVQTRRGSSHAVNEDHYLVTRLGRNHETLFTSLSEDVIPRRFDEFAYAMVVADGMGPAGEVASRLAVAALLELTLRFGQWRVRVEEQIASDIIAKINGFYRQIDSALLHANRSGARVPLHTTLTAAVSGGQDLFFAHVGHSRAYLFRERELVQLTRDHTHAIRRDSLRVSLVDLTDTAADHHHILTDALGAGTNDPQIDIERLTLSDSDVMLLCTNGLTDVVSDQEIAAILASTPVVEEQSAALMARAAAAGASDDATVVVARYHVPA
jgi:PPM family protein phosphatase